MRWRELGVRLVTATRPLSVDDLTAGERATFERLVGTLRRQDWLLGRAALKRLLGGADTSGVSFPHASLSLAHTAGVAVAVAGGSAAGLGVDFERWRPADLRTARFFLHDDERLEHDLLRLWTVKEALFKATPANGGAQLLDYRLNDPASLDGTATDGRGHRFRYVCVQLPAGPLSVALCLGRTNAPV
jgi:hypothetical protein